MDILIELFLEVVGWFFPINKEKKRSKYLYFISILFFVAVIIVAIFFIFYIVRLIS